MNFERKFLISLPTLLDGNFRHSVIYMDQHNGDGAKGWVVNKEIDNRAAVRLRKSIQLGVNAPIYYGGPVDVNQCYVLHSSDISIKQSRLLNTDLYVTRDKEIIKMLNAGTFPKFWKVIIGSASWGAGQLESEVLGSRTNGNSVWSDIEYDQELMWKVPAQDQWNKAIDNIALSKTKNYLNF